MARTNEKTYLQTLMQDSDRKTTLHQIGCDYLAHEENILRLVKHLGRYKEFDWQELSDRGNKLETRGLSTYFENFEIKDKKEEHTVKTNISYPLGDRYILGYLDIYSKITQEFSWVEYVEKIKPEHLPSPLNIRRLGVEPIPETRTAINTSRSDSYETKLFIEVKGHPQHHHDILQQMQTYMVHTSGVIPILATMYPISKYEKQVYLSHGIQHIWIDPEHASRFVSDQNTDVDTSNF
jgi:hypothetical protein